MHAAIIIFIRLNGGPDLLLGELFRKKNKIGSGRRHAQSADKIDDLTAVIGRVVNQMCENVPQVVQVWLPGHVSVCEFGMEISIYQFVQVRKPKCPVLRKLRSDG